MKERDFRVDKLVVTLRKWCARWRTQWPKFPRLRRCRASRYVMGICVWNTGVLGQRMSDNSSRA